MKTCVSKKQRRRLRELDVQGNLYGVSSIAELISQLPAEVESADNRTFRLSIRNLGAKWVVQYVDFTDNERLVGYVWYSAELIDALYKAVRDCAIYNRPKVKNTKKTE